MAVADIFIGFGPSNWKGTEVGSVPSGIPIDDAVFRYWLRGFPGTGVDSSDFIDLNVNPSDSTHGPELQFGVDMVAQGKTCALLKAYKTSSMLTEWLPGTLTGDLFLAEIAEFKAAVLTEFAGYTLRWHLHADIGGIEARQVTSDDVDALPANWALMLAGLEEAIGTKFFDVIFHRTSSGADSAPWLAECRAFQESTGYSPISEIYIDRDDLAYDGLHHPPAAENSVGARMAALYEDLTEMGILTTHSRNALLNHVRNKATRTPPATKYYGAFVAGVEVTGNNYSRASLTNNTTNYSNATSRTKTNAVQILWPTQSGTWGSIDEIREFDASSGGNETARHTLASPVAINTGTGPLVIDPGALDIVWPAGGFTDTVVHELLDLEWGATANSPRATVYGVYLNVSSVEIGSRVAITQATTWGSASSGQIQNDSSITIADQGSAVYWAEYSASSGGTQLFKQALIEAPTGGVIPPGVLRTRLRDAA